MKKNLYILFLIILTSGCTNLEFVYNDYFLKSPLIDVTTLFVEGEDSESASRYLKEGDKV